MIDPLPAEGMYRLLSQEKVLVQLLEIKRLFRPTAHAIANHQAGQLVAIDEDDPLAQVICCRLRIGAEGGGSHEEPLRHLEAIEAAKEVPDCGRADHVARGIALG